MAIPASQIVQVTPRLLVPAGRDLEMNGLFISQSADLPTFRPLAFPGPESVAEFFGVDSVEAKAARVYFQGYFNSYKKPRAMYLCRQVMQNCAGWIRGGGTDEPESALLARLRGVTTGDLYFTLNGQQKSVTGVTFAAATTLSAVAQALQTKINGNESLVTVEYKSNFKAFQITSQLTGATSGVSGCTGYVADVMNLAVADGALESAGSGAFLGLALLESVLNYTTNFVSFTTLSSTSGPTPGSTDVALAGWAVSKGVSYLYVCWDVDPLEKTVDASGKAPTGTKARALQDANAGAVCLVYGGLEYAAMIMGTIASIDYTRRNGTITLAFKQQEGLPATCDDAVSAQNLIANGLNFIGNYATRNDEFVFLYPGQMFGKWKWIDSYINAIWLRNALQVAAMTGFEQTPRVPYTEAGYALIRAWLQDPINKALYCGIIEPGMKLSEAQRSEIIREAGKDIGDEIYDTGYVLIVKDPAPSARLERESPEAALWYSYAGSVHKLDLASTMLA